MADPVGFAAHGAIGVVTVDNPPVNALSPGVPEGIEAALAQGEADPAIRAMVLRGGGRGFIAGADIRFFGKPNRPTSEKARAMLDAATKPVVAAIHGHALGGGLEVALACHWRIATAGARVGLPEVQIGIIPGGGGTQRLPRLIGPAAALDLIVSGRHVPAPEALALGILDELAEDEAALLPAALALAERVAEVRPLRRVRDMQARLAEATPALFAAMRERIARPARNRRAPYLCIEAVEAAVALPFEEGLARERALIDGQVMSAEARGLRYAFFAEREATKIKDLPKDTATRPVRTVAVIGGGTMGTGIAMTCADAGLPVQLLEASPEALQAALARIERTYRTSVERGSLDARAMQERLERISGVADYAGIAEADLAIEAVFEAMPVKLEVFARLDATLRPGAILATNTSALDVDRIAQATRRPQDVVGLHFFSPANVMRMLEIVRGRATSAQTLASAAAFARAIGKIGVACGNCDGFVANRSRAPFSAEANILVEEGCLPQQVDKVLVDFGYPMGPFAVADLAGGDIGHAGRKRRAAADPNFRTLPIADRLVELGRYGQKTGAGWYRYEAGSRTPRPDPEVERIVVETRRELGIEPRAFEAEEILRRLLFASVNEACRIVGEGIAQRACDVDVMWLHGFGFPRYRGGLMHWADEIGVRTVYAQILAWHQAHGPRWAPAPLLADLAASGGSLAAAGR